MSSPAAVAAELDNFAWFAGRFLRLENGQPMQIEDFQRTFLADYFAGTRETLVLLPKKNGKSTLLAALGLYHLITVEDADCVIAAASREQALDPLLKQVRGFVRRSPELRGQLRITQREVRRADDAGKIRVLAADVDTADGALPTLALVDELHRHRSPELYGLLRDGLGPRDGRMIIISTAGDDETSPLGVLRSAAYHGKLERRGAYRYARSTEGSFAMHEWALDPDQDRTDMRVVATANPATWMTEELLAERYASPSTTEWQWARFACGVWMRGEKTAISPLDWARARVDEQIPEGEPITLGIDLGWKWDTTAIVPLWRTPDDKLRLGDPVILTPPRDGTSLPVSAVYRAVEDFMDRYRVQGVAIDPSHDGEHLAQRLSGELDLDVIEHPQQARPMCEAASRFSAALSSGELEHTGHEGLTAHVLAAVPKMLPDGRWRFVKDKKPIDALIAAAMAVSGGVGERSVYEQRGVLSLEIEMTERVGR